MNMRKTFGNRTTQYIAMFLMVCGAGSVLSSADNFALGALAFIGMWGGPALLIWSIRLEKG